MPVPGRSQRVPELLAITLVLAACSLVYELLIAQTLSLLAGNTVIWYSLTVGLYLGAMGLGTAVSKRYSGQSRWDDLSTRRRISSSSKGGLSTLTTDNS